MLAEIIDRVNGGDSRDVVQERVTDPAGLPRLLGLEPGPAQEVATVVSVGEPATAEEIKATFGVDSLPVTEVTPEALLAFNHPNVRAVGVPGGGAAAAPATWPSSTRRSCTTPARPGSPMSSLMPRSRAQPAAGGLDGVPANRSLGLLLAGDDGFSNVRGLGRTVSPRAFGHNGAGGQLAWADPATGLSFGYCTNGIDQHVVREPRRGTAQQPRGRLRLSLTLC